MTPDMLNHIQPVLFSWGAAIGAIVSMAGSYLQNRRAKKAAGRAPGMAENDWTQRYGPGMWDKLRTEGTNLIDNPYGLGTDVRNRLYSNARDTAEAGYGAAQRSSDRTAALSGLSPTGGDASRRGYYAGQQMAEGLNKAYGNVDIQDYMAKEEQKNRGYNLLFSLSNKSPIYSQIASQNYWNSLNASREQAGQYGELLGGAASNLTQYYLDRNQRDNTGNVRDAGYYDLNYNPSAGNPYEQSDYTNQGYQGYDPYGSNP